MFLAVAVFGVATIVFGLSTALPLSVASLALLDGWKTGIRYEQVDLIKGLRE